MAAPIKILPFVIGGSGMKNVNLTYLDEVDFGRLLICISYSNCELKTLEIISVAICLRFG